MGSFSGNSYRYEATGDYQVLGIDYKGGYTMFVLLPKDRFGLEKIMEKLDGDALVKHAKNENICLCEVRIQSFLGGI